MLDDLGRRGGHGLGRQGRRGRNLGRVDDTERLRDLVRELLGLHDPVVQLRGLERLVDLGHRLLYKFDAVDEEDCGELRWRRQISEDDIAELLVTSSAQA